jgi:hypothetical protein
MDHSFKSIYRAPVKSIIYILLLSLAATSLCVSIAIWKYSTESIKEVRNTFTTIGVFSEMNFTEQSYVKADPPLYDYSMLLKVKNSASESIYALSTDRREFVMGFNENISPDNSMRNEKEKYPYAMSIVTGICESIEFSKNSINYTALIRIDYDDLNIIPKYITNVYTPEIMEINGIYITSDNQKPFKVGEKYIIYAYVDGLNPNNDYLSATVDKWAYDYHKYEEIIFYDPATMKEEFSEMPDDKPYFKLTDDSLYMMQRIETTAEDFLEQDNGLWSDRVEQCYVTQHSVEIVLTNNINSIYMFNNGDAYIIQGRNITKEECSSGANVCIVSTQFSSMNNIKVGDKLKLNVYENNFKIVSHIISKANRETGWQTIQGKDTVDIWLSKGFDVDKGFYKEVEYEIVGTYLVDNRGDKNEFNFINNTMFAPSESIEGSFNTEPTVLTLKRYTDKLIYTDLLRTSVPGSFSVVIKNGYAEHFEADMEQAGYGGIFRYFDQGYSKVSKTLDEYSQISLLVALISIGVWMTVVVVFIVTCNSKSRKDIAIMRSLGSPKGRAYMTQLFTVFILSFMALVICIIAGLYVYNIVTDIAYADMAKGSNAASILKNVIESSKGAVVVVAITQFLTIIGAFAIVLSIQVRQNVMVMMRKGKKQ